MIRITPYKGRSDAWLIDIRLRLTTGIMHRERYKSPARTLTATRTWAEARERAILVDGPRPETSKGTRLGDFAERWIREHAEAEGHKASGIAGKKLVLRKYILPELGELALEDLGAEHVQQLKAAIGKPRPWRKTAELRALSVKSRNEVLTVLGRMLRSAVEWNVIDKAPPVRLLRKAASPAMSFYDFEEYARLVAAARALSWERYAVVLFGGDAGLRRSEIIAIEWRDIDFSHGSIVVSRAEPLPGIVGSPKSGKSRRIPMTKRLAAVLEQHRQGRGRIFQRADKKNYSAETVRSAVKLAAKRAGLSKVGVHILRHTFCSHLAMRGAALIEIKELAGHQSVTTTQRYMHLSPASADRAIQLLDAGHKEGTKLRIA